MAVTTLPHARLADREDRLDDCRDRVYRVACALRGVGDLTEAAISGDNNEAHARREYLSCLFTVLADYLEEAHEVMDAAACAPRREVRS